MVQPELLITLTYEFKDNVKYYQELYKYLDNNVHNRNLTQNEIYEKIDEIVGFDPNDPNNIVYIEDDDGTLYTQEEWRNKNK